MIEKKIKDNLLLGARIILKLLNSINEGSK